jgi:hypothetical protein
MSVSRFLLAHLRPSTAPLFSPPYFPSSANTAISTINNLTTLATPTNSLLPTLRLLLQSPCPHRTPIPLALPNKYPPVAQILRYLQQTSPNLNTLVTPTNPLLPTRLLLQSPCPPTNAPTDTIVLILTI